MGELIRIATHPDGGWLIHGPGGVTWWLTLAEACAHATALAEGVK